MFSATPRSILRQARALGATRPLSASQSTLFARLASTLALLEHKDGKLNTGSLAAITAAQRLGGSITAFAAGSGVKTVAEEAAKIDGLGKVVTVENSAYDKGLPENYAPMLVENIKKGGYTHVIVGTTAFGKNILPRVAALMDCAQVSDVMEIQGEDSKSQA